MAVSYKKLWKLLIDKEMMKKDLRSMTGVRYNNDVLRLSKDENVSTEILSKICSALNCDVGDIMEFVPDKKKSSKEGLFYHSEVYQLMRDGVSDMHCMSDLYFGRRIKTGISEKITKGYALRKAN